MIKKQTAEIHHAAAITKAESAPRRNPRTACKERTNAGWGAPLLAVIQPEL